MRKLQDINYTQQTVLYRADYNVPCDADGTIHDWQAWRIEATLPTLEHLIEQGCKIIIVAHFGRPKGKKDESLMLKPVAEKLAEFLNREAQTVTPKKPPEILQKLGKITNPCYLLPQKGNRGDLESLFALKAGSILILDNLRFYTEERKNSPEFAHNLAQLADIYVSDAFAASHRKHASIYALPQKLPAYGGLLIQEEAKTLTRIREEPKSPLYLLLGGAKVATKATLIKSFLPKLKGVLLGGVVANTILQAKGLGVGTSKLPRGLIEDIDHISLNNRKIHLPSDVKTAPNPQAINQISVRSTENISPEKMILDIGPKTVKKYKSILKGASEIVWNGNLGLSEVSAFSQGTKEIGKAVKKSRAFSIVGGGDTVAFLRKINVASGISFCSTGGGAMLEFLAGKELPGIEVLS